MQLATGIRPRFRKRSGFSLREVRLVAALLGICAVGVTSTWAFCYSMNDQTRQMQATQNILQSELEQVRRLNWIILTEQTSWVTRYFYDRSGNPVGAPETATAVTGGFVSYR